jgi:zinc transporter, ZIP family
LRSFCQPSIQIREAQNTQSSRLRFRAPRGRSAPFAIGIWALTAVLLTAAVVFGRGVFAQFPEEHLAFPLAFAGGAVLASLADTLMPEAFEHGRPLNSMATAAGFLVSLVLSG